MTPDAIRTRRTPQTPAFHHPQATKPERQKTTEPFRFEGMIGHSSVMKMTLAQVTTVAPTDATVLITGETGTGKGLIARAVHNLSPRRDQEFVRFKCAAIP